MWTTNGSGHSVLKFLGNYHSFPLIDNDLLSSVFLSSPPCCCFLQLKAIWISTQNQWFFKFSLLILFVFLMLLEFSRGVGVSKCLSSSCLWLLLFFVWLGVWTKSFQLHYGNRNSEPNIYESIAQRSSSEPRAEYNITSNSESWPGCLKDSEMIGVLTVDWSCIQVHH